MLKHDLEKAFDKLVWSFIHRALVYFKFPPKISKLIMACITTSSIAIFVNVLGLISLTPLKGFGKVTLCLRTFSSYA